MPVNGTFRRGAREGELPALSATAGKTLGLCKCWRRPGPSDRPGRANRLLPPGSSIAAGTANPPPCAEPGAAVRPVPNQGPVARAHGRFGVPCASTVAAAPAGRCVLIRRLHALLPLAWLLLAAVPASAPATETPGAAPAILPDPRLWDEGSLLDHVLQLVDDRLALMPLVAGAKWQHRQPIADPAREAAVIATAGERAVRLGLERAPVEALFAVQIRLAREAQARLTDHWDSAGYDGITPVPDLARDLRPQIDRLTGDLLGALYLLAPYANTPDFAAKVATAAGRALPATRWSSTDRQALAEGLVALRPADRGGADRARAAGLVRFGTPADYAPFSSSTAGTVRGADVELAMDLARSLGLEAVFVRSSWRTLVEDLLADHFDIAIGGVSATPARLSLAEASVPLSQSGKTAVGRCADAGRFTALERIDRSGVTVIENPGGTNEAFARAHLAAARLVVHPDNQSVFEELLARRADVMFTDETEIRLVTRRYPQLCRLLGDSYERADKVFLYGKGRGWAAAAGSWLETAAAAGRPAQLLDRYIGP